MLMSIVFYSKNKKFIRNINLLLAVYINILMMRSKGCHKFVGYLRFVSHMAML